MLLSKPDKAKTWETLMRRARGRRRIRNVDILSNDITPLIEGNKKLGMSTINAVNAKLQILAEAKGRLHWAVLSAWLGPLVEGTVQEGKYVSTILEHVQKA
ncbi:hypothetical protein C0995_000124, partial [Termitomyces sp. Mi166